MNHPTQITSWSRPLLPGALLESSPTRRSARDWIVDLLMLLLALIVGVFILATTWSDHGSATATIDIAVGVAALISLWWRRTHPTAIATFTLAVSAFSGLAAGASAAALFTAAIRSSRRALAWLTALAVAVTATYPILYPDNGGGNGYVWQLIIGLTVNGLVIGWGLFARARRELVHSLRQRAEQLEADREREVAGARDAERRRIAREMHDVLAHRVSLVSLQAGALEFRPDAPPEEIAAAAGVIRASARDALQELRDVIGVLREDGGDALEPPQPTLAHIPALVEESRAAGTRVHFQGTAIEGLPATVGRTAYRIVQEGLTNARKHAPGAAVDVSVQAEPGPRLVVQVRSRPAVGVGGTPRLPGSGTGLIGLSERVALVGGQLEHGFTSDGDFVLRATLPWSSA